MFKLVVILLIALVIEAVGVNCLGKGLKQIGGPQSITALEITRAIARGAANRWILLGTALEAIFFLMLLALLKQHEVSLIWPLTSLGFVLTTLSAKFINDESVGVLRWGGVVLIVIGATLVGWSDAVKRQRDKTSGLDQSSLRPPLQ
jgi:drug/metabolite transporter (DMT)-like permease